MALQGTLDTFALPDVLRLLASTNKTGCLRVDGSRGEGEVWFRAGGIVAAVTVGPLPTNDPVEVLCDLLRSAEGHFVFETDAAGDHEGDALDVEPLLVEAEQLVTEWAEIEEVVPSLDAWVALVDELPKAKVSVDAGSWKVILAVAAGSTVRDVGSWLATGELAVSRAVRDLVKLGLATVTDAPAAPEVAVEAGAPALESDWEHAAPWAEETQWVEDPGYLSFTPERQANPVYEEIGVDQPYEPFEAFSPFDRPAGSDTGSDAGATAVDGPEAPASLAEALPDVPDVFDQGAFDEPAGLPADEGSEPEIATEIESAGDPAEEPAPIDRSRLLKFLGSVGK